MRLSRKTDAERTPEEVADKARRKRNAQEVRALAATPEMIVLAALAVFFCLCVSLGPSLLNLASFVILVSALLAVIWTTLLTGSHGLALVASLATGLAAVMAGGRLLPSWPTGVVLGIGSAVFVALDLFRFNAARRRNAFVDPRVGRSVFASTAAVVLASALTVGLLAALTDDAESRSWLWVPAVSLVVVAISAVVLFTLFRGAARSDVGRWKPGAIMVPPPKSD